MSVTPADGRPVPGRPARFEYPNPPIEEALCQVVFAEPLEWNVATPGLLFDVLREQYPQVPEGQEQIAAAMEMAGDSDGPSFSVNRGPARYVYKDSSGTRLVVASPTTFSANSLRPYEGWESLQARLKAAIAQLQKVTSLRTVSHVTLRYINRIIVHADVLNSDDYFTIPVRTPERAKASYVGFLQRVESVLTDRVTRVTSTFATLEAPEGEQHFLLDLEFRRSVATSDLDVVFDVANELKEKENEEFESCITLATRELFK